METLSTCDPLCAATANPGSWAALKNVFAGTGPPTGRLLAPGQLRWPHHMQRVVRKLLDPVFAYLSRRVPHYAAIVDPRFEDEFATRLGEYLTTGTVLRRVRAMWRQSATPREWRGPALVDAIPFLWSFCAVDVDLFGWCAQFPFLPSVNAILQDLPQSHLPMYRDHWHRYGTPPCMFDTPHLVEYAQLVALHRCVGYMPPGGLEPHDTRRVAACVGSVSRAYRRRMWALRAACYRRGVNFAVASVAGFAYGGGQWLDILELVER